MNAPRDRKTLDLSDWRETSAAEYDLLRLIVAPELQPFLEDHAALARLMDEVRAGYSREVYAEALRVIGRELNSHFRFEETILLHYLSRHIPAADVGPAYKLKQEHEIIRARHREAVELFEANDETARDVLVQKMNLLAYLLKKHIEKEDHYFLPMASAILTPEEKQRVAEELARAHG